MKLRVPVPEFQTWNVWVAALHPCVHEFVRDAGEYDMAGEMTVRLTGMVCGLFDEPGSVIVIFAV